MKALALALALAGCGGSSPKQVAEPADPVAQKPAAPSCVAVADRISVVMSQTSESSSDLHAIAETVKIRCGEDRWTDEARECYGTAENATDAEGCEKLLTADQKTSIDKAIEAKLGASAADQTAMIQKLDEFADQACKCKANDADCAKKVSDDMTKWAESQPKMGQVKPDPRIEAAAKKLTECLTQAMMPKDEPKPAAAPARRSRGGTPKKPVPKSSSDPDMGGE